MTADTEAQTHIVLAPYLPLAGPVSVGPWTLVPFKQFFEIDEAPKKHEDHLRRLVDAYEIEDAPAPLGAVGYLAAQGISGRIEREQLRQLSQALLVGVLVENPPLAVDDEKQNPNAGHGLCTAENALAFGHVLSDGNWHVIESGFLARTLALKIAEDGRFPKIAPPNELHVPLRPRFDSEMADAAYGALADGAPYAERLSRALDWFRVVFSNSSAVTMQVRIGAIRSAIEAFLQKNATKKVVSGFERTVANEDDVLVAHEAEFWDGPREFTPAGWWLTRLSKLRNDIVHGNPIADEDWGHEGHPHFNWGHDYLLELLRRTVTVASQDLALQDRMTDRLFTRALDAFLAADAEPDDTEQS